MFKKILFVWFYTQKCSIQCYNISLSSLNIYFNGFLKKCKGFHYYPLNFSTCGLVLVVVVAWKLLAVINKHCDREISTLHVTSRTSESDKHLNVKCTQLTELTTVCLFYLFCLFSSLQVPLRVQHGVCDITFHPIFHPTRPGLRARVSVHV